MIKLLFILIYLFLHINCVYAIATNLTNGYIPYVSSTSCGPNGNAACTSNSPGFTNGTNIGIGSIAPAGTIDVGTGSVCINHVCNFSWPSTSQWATVGSTINYPTGNVGIGSVNPQTALDAGSGTITAAAISLTGSGNTLLNQSAGNVGIGSATPGIKLDVQGSVRMTGFLNTTSPSSGYVLTSDSHGSGTWQAASGGSSTSGTLLLFGNGSGGFTNATTTSVSGGNIGIGTVVPTNLLTWGSTGQSILTTAGNVGINTAVAGNTLVVNGTAQVIGSGQTLINNGLVLAPGAVVTNSGSTLTLTAANMAKNAVFQETGTTAATFTLDTGTALSSAITGIGSVTVGQMVSFVVSNASTQTITMAGATGITMANAVTVLTLQSRTFYAINTGSNTWTIF